MKFWFGLFSCLVAVGVALPAVQHDSESLGALVEPRTDTQKCLDVSRSFPRWEVSSLQFTTINYTTGGRTGDIQFSAYNVAVDTRTNCFAEDINMQGTSPIWHNCSAAGTSFQFSLTDYGLKLKGSWTCGDSPETVFTGEGNISTGILHCEDYPYGVKGWQTVCDMNDGTVEVTLTSPVNAKPE